MIELRSLTGTALNSMVMPSGLIMPPPRPWITRNATRLALFQASPHSSEPTVNSAIVIRNRRLVPKVSERKPVAGLIDTCPSSCLVLVGVRVLRLVELRGRRGHHVLLLGEVVGGVRRLRLGQLLFGCLHERLLRGDVLLRRGLLCERHLLGSLIDGVLRSLDVLGLRPRVELIQMRLIGDQLLARCVDLRLRGLALRLERAILCRREARLGDHELALRSRQLALGVVVLRLELCALRLDTAVGEGIEPGPGGFDQCLGAGELSLQRGLLSRGAATLQQVELALGGLDGGVASVYGGTGSVLGRVARAAVGLLIRLSGDRAHQRSADAGSLVLQRGLVGFGGRLLRLCLRQPGLGLGGRGLRRVVRLV
jgi:hypothetical protein